MFPLPHAARSPKCPAGDEKPTTSYHCNHQRIFFTFHQGFASVSAQKSILSEQASWQSLATPMAFTAFTATISHLSMKTSHSAGHPFFHDMFNISSSISKRMVRPEWPARTPWGIGVHGQHDLSCITWLRNGFHMVPWYGSMVWFHPVPYG